MFSCNKKVLQLKQFYANEGVSGMFVNINLTTWRIVTLMTSCC